MLKYFTGADVTSYKVKCNAFFDEQILIICRPSNFQLKWALKQKLLNVSPADVGGLGAALRLVLTHKSLRDKFTGVNRELEEAGIRSIEVTDKGFRLIRDQDTKLNQEIPFGEDTKNTWLQCQKCCRLFQRPKKCSRDARFHDPCLLCEPAVVSIRPSVPQSPSKKRARSPTPSPATPLSPVCQPVRLKLRPVSAASDDSDSAPVRRSSRVRKKRKF